MFCFGGKWAGGRKGGKGIERGRVWWKGDWEVDGRRRMGKRVWREGGKETDELREGIRRQGDRNGRKGKNVGRREERRHE